MEQSQYETTVISNKTEICPECGGAYTQKGYLDHLFSKRECMRKYWEEEEKNHISRLRHRTAKNLVR